MYLPNRLTECETWKQRIWKKNIKNVMINLLWIIWDNILGSKILQLQWILNAQTWILYCIQVHLRRNIILNIQKKNSRIYGHTSVQTILFYNFVNNIELEVWNTNKKNCVHDVHTYILALQDKKKMLTTFGSVCGCFAISDGAISIAC